MHGLDDAEAHVQLYVCRKMYSETQMGPTGICVFWAGDTGGQALHMECGANGTGNRISNTVTYKSLCHFIIEGYKSIRLQRLNLKSQGWLLLISRQTSAGMHLPDFCVWGAL